MTTSCTDSCDLQESALQTSTALCFDGSQMSATGLKGRSGRGAAGRKVSCDSCYFKCNLLCALQLDEPCATYRPDSPEGLRPPSQLRFVFRNERRTQSAWAFPSAQEQAALHA